MLDENGNPEKRFGTMQGITERKQAEDRIKGLAKFPEENPTPVMRIFKDGKILYNNKASMVLLDSWGSQTGAKDKGPHNPQKFERFQDLMSES